MRAVEFNRFGGPEVLEVVADAAHPVLGAGQVEIRVAAASVNPSDCAIRSGYGAEVFRRKGQVGAAQFPQRLGRDLAGVVTAVAPDVAGFGPGDRVYAAPTHATLAEYVCVNAVEVARMPANLDFVAAASLPFVALVSHVGLTPDSSRGRRVIVTRGAGGVGAFAIQLMKAWGAHVATTCSTRNQEFVRALGADVVVDYSRQKVGEALRDYDVVLDGSFDLETELLETLRRDAGAAYVTIVSPKIHLVDEFGLADGLARAEELFEQRSRQQQALGRR